MKIRMKTLLMLSVGLAAAALSGCSDDRIFDEANEGKVVIKTTFNSDVKVQSRSSLEDELSASTMLWISNEKGLVRRYQGLDNVPADGIKLVGGSYIAEVWAGDSVPASFDSRYFKGSERFTITSGVTQVNLVCKIANVVASVNYDATVDDVLKDYQLTVGHHRGELTFEGRDGRRGYFMMPSNADRLTWTLTGTQIDGKPYTKTGEILNPKSATEYAVNVKFTPGGSAEIGGGFIEIVVDESEIAIEDTITITSAPIISGIGFNINEDVVSEPGKLGKRSVSIAALTGLQSVVIKSEILNTLIGGEAIDLMSASNTILETLADGGISFVYLTDAEGENATMKVIFEESLLNSLTASTSFEFSATDAAGKTAVVQMNIVLSDASVATDNIVMSDVWSTSATISGKVLKDDVTNPGIEYRRSGDAGWTFVAANNLSRAQSFTVELSGLTPGTTYEYRAVCDGFISSSVQSFKTEEAAQLPNAGFEDWCTYDGKITIPGADYATTYWDSGNHGSSTMSVNITSAESNIKHSGNYSAKLRSQFVGMMGIGKFAAGNIFVGNYLYTDGTDGELGWGRQFNSRPKAVRVWVKYEPGTVVSGNNKGSGDKMPVGSLDKGVIYMAITDGSTVKYETSKSNFKGTEWPCVVKTKSKQLFDPNGPNVIGYAEIALDEATPGDGLVEMTATINYIRTDITASNVIFVASASRFGDYFQGGEGSTLYLDDVEMIY